MRIALIKEAIVVIFLGGSRSLIAPPINMNKARGIAADIKTKPTAKPEPVFWSTNQANETNQN